MSSRLSAQAAREVDEDSLSSAAGGDQRTCLTGEDNKNREKADGNVVGSRNSRTGRRRKRNAELKQLQVTTSAGQVSPPFVFAEPKWRVDFWYPESAPVSVPRLPLSLLIEKIPARFNPKLQSMIEQAYDCRNGLRDVRLALAKEHPDATKIEIEAMLTNAKLREADEKRKCPRCWMLPRLCFCDSVRPLKPCPVKIIVYMHWKEAARRAASNTAKLVPMLLDGGCIVACGDVDAEAAMHAEIVGSDSVAVLYPSSDAISVKKWISSITEESSMTSSGSDLENEITNTMPKATIILLDGTWSDAKFLNKAIPADIPRVKLSTVAPAAIGDLRTRWAHPDDSNLQSFNAIIVALAEAGMVTKQITDLTERLREAISYYTKQTFPEKGFKRATNREVNRQLKAANPTSTFQDRVNLRAAMLAQDRTADADNKEVD